MNERGGSMHRSRHRRPSTKEIAWRERLARAYSVQPGPGSVLVEHPRSARHEWQSPDDEGGATTIRALAALDEIRDKLAILQALSAAVIEKSILPPALHLASSEADTGGDVIAFGPLQNERIVRGRVTSVERLKPFVAPDEVVG